MALCSFVLAVIHSPVPYFMASGCVCYNWLQLHRHTRASSRALKPRAAVVTQAADKQYDYDLVIIGCGVGGHGAAMHAVEQVCIHPRVLCVC